MPIIIVYVCIYIYIRTYVCIHIPLILNFPMLTPVVPMEVISSSPLPKRVPSLSNGTAQAAQAGDLGVDFYHQHMLGPCVLVPQFMDILTCTDVSTRQ